MDTEPLPVCADCGVPRVSVWAAAWEMWLCHNCRDYRADVEFTRTGTPEGWTDAVRDRVPAGPFTL